MAQLKTVLTERAAAVGLVSAADLERGRVELGRDADDARLLEWVVKQGLLTKWQVTQLETGRTQNLSLAHYRLLAPLGAGGMGSVYRALDTKLNRQVALKVLPPRQATPEAIIRFRREGFVALQMRHENVVTAIELAQQGTVHFLVMELVDGPSLRAHLAKQGRLSVRETARIGRDVALALQHAHEQGIIHRDIKPSNILLSRQGKVKVADMGLAKFFGPQAPAGGPETRTGQFMGTIDYCSPEQAVDAKRADIRSDIYSLGCTLYHCLTGEPPFAEGTEVQRIMAHIELLPSSIRLKNADVPPAFAELIERRMLAKDPGDRFQTPAEAAEALAPWIKGEGPTVNPWAGPERLDDLLAIAAQAPRMELPGGARQSDRDTARRPRSPSTLRGIKLRLGAKDRSVFTSPLAWAAVVLVVLGVAVGASLMWPRQVANVNEEGTTDVGNEREKRLNGDGTDDSSNKGDKTGDDQTDIPPYVHPPPSPTPGFVRRSSWKDDDQQGGWEAHIWDLSFSPDGRKYLAAGDAGPHGGVRLYDVVTDRLLQKFVTGKEVWFANAAFVSNDLVVTAYTQDRNIYLWDARTGNLVDELPGHTDNDVHVVVSHDGRHLVSYGKDNSLRLWDMDQRRGLWKQDASGQEIARVVFSPDDASILTSGGDHQLRIRELKSGRVVATLEAQAPPYCGEFSPDDKRVLSWSLDGQVRLWDPATAQTLRSFEVAPDGARKAWFLQGGRQVITWGKDGVFQVWDAETGRRLKYLALGETAPSRWSEACISPDNRYLLVATEQGAEMRVIDIESGVRLYHADKETLARPKGFVFSPNGRYAAAGSFRAGVYLIEFPVPWENVERQTAPSTATSHVESATASNVDQPPQAPPAPRSTGSADDSGEDTPFAGGGGGTRQRIVRPGELLRGFECSLGKSNRISCIVDLVPIFSGKPPGRHPHLEMAPDGYAVGALNVEGQYYVSAIQPVYMRIKRDGRLAPDDHHNGRWIGFRAHAHSATLSGEGTPVIGIHLRRGTVLDSLALVIDRKAGPAAATQTLSGHTGGVWAIAFSPDGSLLASGGDNGMIRLWKPQDGYAPRQQLGAHRGRVRGLTFSPDGKTLASTGFDKTVRFWNAMTGVPRGQMQDTSIAYYPAFSKDGTVLVTGSDDNPRVWNVVQQKLAYQLKGHQGTAWAVAASGASKLIATGGPHPAIRLWHDDGKLARVLNKRSSGVNALTFSPNGDILASAERDSRQVCLWDPANGEVLRTLPAHRDTVYDVAFSPDGKWLATACDDGVIRLWNAESSDLHTTYRGSGLSLAFSPDGKHLVVGCTDSSVRVWQLEDAP